MTVETCTVLISLDLADGPDAPRQVEQCVGRALASYAADGWEPDQDLGFCALRDSGSIQEEAPLLCQGTRRFVSVVVRLQRSRAEDDP